MSKEKSFGVIPWNAENIYRRPNVVASYVYESAAQKACDKLNNQLRDNGQPMTLVVRDLQYMRES